MSGMRQNLRFRRHHVHSDKIRERNKSLSEEPEIPGQNQIRRHECGRSSMSKPDNSKLAHDLSKKSRYRVSFHSTSGFLLIFFRSFSHRYFKQYFIPDLNSLHTRDLFLIEVKAEHITCGQIEIIQIFADLLFAIRFITLTSPYLEFYNILLTKIIYYDIRPCLISGLSFYIVISSAIDDWFQIQKE